MTLLLTRSDINSLLTMEEAIKVTEVTFAELAQRRTPLLNRTVIRVAQSHSHVDFMPGRLEATGALGAKLQVVREPRARAQRRRVCGLIALFAPDAGEIHALLDAETITTVRAGATTAVAARLLARKRAAVAGLFGAGPQAFGQLRGLAAVRKIERVLVQSLDGPEHMEKFTARVRDELAIEAEVESDPAVLAGAADVLVAATTATQPLVRARWLKPGVHISAVGSDRPTARELDAETLQLAGKVVCDYTPAVVRESADLAIPLQTGEFSEARIYADLGELILGRRAGRTSNSEITVFKSVGLGLQDIALAGRVYQLARERQVGQEIDFSAV